MAAIIQATAVMQAIAALLAALFNLILAHDAYTAKEKAWKVVVPALSAVAFLVTAAVRAGLVG